MCSSLLYILFTLSHPLHIVIATCHNAFSSQTPCYPFTYYHCWSQLVPDSVLPYPELSCHPTEEGVWHWQKYSMLHIMKESPTLPNTLPLTMNGSTFLFLGTGLRGTYSQVMKKWSIAQCHIAWRIQWQPATYVVTMHLEICATGQIWLPLHIYS